jgi:hypothetical protein
MCATSPPVSSYTTSRPQRLVRTKPAPRRTPQRLTDERLGRPDRVDQFVDAVRVISKQVDNGEADGGGQRTEQLARQVTPATTAY